MTPQRATGYVLGSDRRPGDGKRVWKVRVKDPDHSDNGKKFVVAEEEEGEEFPFAKGLAVTFLIGQFQEFGQPTRKAYNVEPIEGQEE